MRFSWDDRIRRAGELGEKYPFVREVLSFYREVLLFQMELASSLSSRMEDPAVQGNPIPRSALPLETEPQSRLAAELLWRRDEELLVSFLPQFLTLIERIGTEALSGASRRLLASPDGAEGRRLLRNYWAEEATAHDLAEDPTLAFFPKAFLQPYAELLAAAWEQPSAMSQAEWRVRQGARASCPYCGRPPQLGFLTPEGEGAGRRLLCTLCGTDWRYKRICCPSCGEEDFGRLSYSRSDDFPHIRLETCTNCKHYLTTVDLTVDGRAVPPADEIASAPLDLWAIEQGYTKIEPNLLGL